MSLSHSTGEHAVSFIIMMDRILWIEGLSAKIVRNSAPSHCSRRFCLVIWWARVLNFEADMFTSCLHMTPRSLYSATSQEKRWASLCLPFGKINIWLLLCILAAEWMDTLIIQCEWWFWASKDPEEIAIQHLFGHDQWCSRDLQLLRFNVHDGSKYRWRLDVMVPVYWLHAMKTFTFLVGRG